MTKGDPEYITPEREAILAHPRFTGMDRDAAERRLYNEVSAILSASIENLAKFDEHAVRETLDFALHHLGSGSPDVSLDEEMARRDAERWARQATQSELVRYGEACLRNVPDKTMHPGLLRRVLANVWKRLDANDRRRFLDRVAADKNKRAGQE